MFVSAGVELKVHSSSDEGLETHVVQYPSSNSKIINVSVCNDNSYIAVLRENEKPQILSAKDLENVRLIHVINTPNVSALTFKHNTKKNIALGTKTGDVVMYDTKTRTVADEYRKITECVKALDFTCDDQQLCGLDNNIFFVFPEIGMNNQVKKYRQTAECSFLKCHPFIPNRVAVGCKNGRIGLWDVQNGVELLNFSICTSPVSGVAMSSCGNYLIASGKELKICGIDFATCAFTFQYKLDQEKPVSSVDLSVDDKFLAVGLADGTLKLYDVKHQMRQIYSCKLHDSPINIISFENKAKEINSNFSSVVKLCSETGSQKNENVGACFISHDNSIKTKSIKTDIRVENKDASLDKMKKCVLKVIKHEIDSLENQLQEHCNKFQKFLDNEFETIDATIKKKWDIFNVGDINTFMKAAFPEEEKSACE